MIKIKSLGDMASPYDVADALITATTKRINWRGEEVEDDAFTIEELKKIGQHLIRFAEIEGHYDD